MSRKELEKIGDEFEIPEMCSNCGEKKVYVYLVTAFSVNMKEFLPVLIRQCNSCLHLSSIASRGWAGC